MITHKTFVFNPFQENTYVIYLPNRDCVIIDPGCHSLAEQSLISGFIKSNGLNPKAVWLTHAHIDHVLGLDYFVTTWKIPYLIHQNEVAQLKSVEVYAPNYGFQSFQSCQAAPTIISTSSVLLGNEEFEILNVPGHSPGHVAFFHKSSGQIWAGDVLFNGSIGRTDLPGGDFNTLKESIQNKLYVLDDKTIVFPGHGPSTEIGFEKLNNPFVKA